MIEAFSAFKCSKNTFYLSVNIMDEFLTKTTNLYSSNDIHLIGISSIFVGSKIAEIVPFKIGTIVEKMGHGKIRKEKILEMENLILNVLSYKMYDLGNFYVYIELLLVKMNFHLKKYFVKILSVCNYISKVVLFDYDIMMGFEMKYLAASCIYLCLKIISQAFGKINSKMFVSKIKSMLNLEDQEFYKCSKVMLDLSKDFKKKYDFVKNLEKFESFSI